MEKEKLFVKNLKRIMNVRGISQRELAEKINITETSLSRYINGTREPKASIIIKIADSLGITIDQLYTEKVDIKDKVLRVEDILNYCEKCADTNHNLLVKSLDKAFEKDYMLSAIAYFDRQEKIYRYEIPDIIKNITL